MSSKYADKHSHKPDCAMCFAPAEKLMLLSGQPYWLCETHYEEHQHGRSA